MAIKANSLRIGGLNSGLDTEAIVNAMSASTKLRITTNQRKVMKLQGQQAAYRQIIDKFNGFKNKYFDILNTNTYLKSRTTFNKYTANLSQGGAAATPAGVKVTTGTNATAGNYSVTINNAATQASLTSKPMDSQAVTFTAADYADGNSYALGVSVNGTTKIITFSGADETAAIDSLNDSLKTAFGKTNTDTGLVYATLNTDGTVKFNSTEKKAITTGVVTQLGDTVGLSGIDTVSGNNNITVIVGGEFKSISFQTLANDYFEGLAGKVSVNSKGALELASGATAEEKAAFSVFNSVINDMYKKQVQEAYDQWKTDQGSAYNPDFRNVKLTGDDKMTALSSLTLDTPINFSSAVGILDEEDRTAEVNNIITNYLKTASAGDKDAVNQTLDGALLDKMKGSMSSEQVALFEYEFSNKVAEREQQDYDKALLAAYDEFDKIQRAGGKTIADPDYVWFDSLAADGVTPSWLDQMGYSKNVEDAKMGGYWSDTDPTFGADYTKSQNAMLEELPFLQIGYSEINAYFNSYADTSVASPVGTESFGDFASNYVTFSSAEIASYFNENTINQKVGSLTFAGGVKVDLAFDRDLDGNVTGVNISTYTLDSANNKVYRSENDVGAYSNEGNNFGLVIQEATANTITTSSKLGELGLTIDTVQDQASYNAALQAEYGKFDAWQKSAEGGSLSIGDPGYKDYNQWMTDKGYDEDVAAAGAYWNSGNTTFGSYYRDSRNNANYSIEINGQKLTFGADTTIKQMMDAVNANASMGVNMTFSTITGTFEFKSKEYGTAADITLGADPQGLLQKLGFDGVDVVQGKNMSLTIDGLDIETSSNSYEFNGITITANSNVQDNTSFDIEVQRDNSQLLNIIKDFVNDYNDLVKYVYGYIDDKPDKDYYFLTDADREELGLTESQDKKWEEKAVKGLLYNDQTLISVMSKLRTEMYSGIDRGDGTIFALFSMGITTSDNWKNHGQLVIDEKKLSEALDNNLDMVTELFTNPEKGLMAKLEAGIKSAVYEYGSRSEKGVLIQKAGTSGLSDKDNAIYDQIKSLNNIISSFQMRYDKQQDRYWKIFSALEKQMGQLNGQTGYIDQLMNYSTSGKQ